MNESSRSVLLTDGDCAERLVAAHRDDLRYCHERKAWFIWKDTRWVMDRREEACQRVWAVMRAARSDAPNAEWAPEVFSGRGLKATLRIARYLPGIPISPEMFDRDPLLFNCANGTLDLRTGELRPHRREDYLTKLAPVEYDPAASAPRWEAFLAEIAGEDPELVAFLQRAVGRALAGSDEHAVVCVLYGDGANGKTTFLRALMETLGDYAVVWPQARTRSAATDGPARVVVCDGDPALVERLAGRDTTPFRSAFVATNHLPVIARRQASSARIYPLPFNVSTATNREHDLIDMLRAERAGILRWAVEGYRRGLAGYLELPSRLRASLLSSGARALHLHAAFLEERCERHPGFTSLAAELHGAYVDWCAARAITPIARRFFAEMLLSNGCFQDRTATARYWRGIAVKAEWKQAAREVGASDRAN